MRPNPYRFGPVVLLVLIPICTFTVMAGYQWLKHFFFPDITIAASHIHTTIFLTIIATVGGFLLCRYLEAASMLASIVASSEDGIIGITMDGTIFSWNHGAERIYGYSAREAIGRSASILASPDRPEDIRKVIEKIQSGQRIDHYETSRMRKDGQTVYVSITVSPILNAAGGIIGASSVIRDITWRKAAEEELRKSLEGLARTQAFSLVMVAHLGLDGRWLKVPPNLCTLLEYSEEEMLAGKFEDVTYPGDTNEERELFRDLIDGRIKSGDIEKRCVAKNGQLVWVYLNYSIVADSEGRPLHFLVYLRDITKRRMAEEELKQTNAYLENVFENSPDAIGIVDEHGKFKKWNRMAAELYGYSFEELRQRSGFDMYDDGDALASMLSDLRRDGSVRKREMRMRKRDGSVVPIEVSIGLLPGGEGRVLGSVCLARDLSDIKKALAEVKASNERLSEEVIIRKKAQDEVQRLDRQNRMILNAAGEGIAGLDLSGNITFINPAGAEVVGYEIQELIGRDLHEMVHHSRPDGSNYPLEECPMNQSLLLGVARRERNEVFWKKDGTSFPVAYASTPMLEEGRILGAVVTFRDITSRKRAQDELTQYRDHLEDLVKERTVELATANEHLTHEIDERTRAEKALQQSSDKLKLFAYSVAHDLKSPAIGIHGLTKLLYKQCGHMLDGKGKMYCEQVMKVSEHIAALVELINIFIAAKETPLSFEKIELKKEILRMLKDEFSARFSIRQIRWIEPQSEVSFSGDRLSILRAFRNLVDNALKYGGEQLSKIWIEHEESENLHIFSVKNDGHELDAADSEKLFEVFQRHESSLGIEGIGLGLAIVKEIAERHGGKIWLGPQSPNTITFKLSISKTPGSAADIPAAGALPLTLPS